MEFELKCFVLIQEELEFQRKFATPESIEVMTSIRTTVQGKMGTSPGPMQVAMSPNPEHNERGVMGGFIGQAASLCNG